MTNYLEMTCEAAEELPGFINCVYLDNEGRCRLCTSQDSRVPIGICGRVKNTDKKATVYLSGAIPLDNDLFLETNTIPGSTLYMGRDGKLTSIVPGSGQLVVRLGWATQDHLLINIQSLGRKA